MATKVKPSVKKFVDEFEQLYGDMTSEKSEKALKNQVFELLSEKKEIISDIKTAELQIKVDKERVAEIDKELKSLWGEEKWQE